MLLPTALVRGGGQLRAPLGRWPPAPCLRWRRQPPLSPSALLRGAQASVWTQAGGLGAEKSGRDSKHVSVRRDQKDEALLSAARKGKSCAQR